MIGRIRNIANKYLGLNRLARILYWLLFPSAYVMRWRKAKGRWVINRRFER